MKTISLMYHDVVRSDQLDSSGFPGADAALYKLTPDQFRHHIQSIRDLKQDSPLTVFDLDTSPRPTRFLITFDDGGRSAFTTIADVLEREGWRGHFFVTAGRVGERAFMNLDQIRELHRRGHVIGSHSLSHPLRMSRCSWDEMTREWSTSVKILSDVLGEPIRVASVPGGSYSEEVARAAALSGIEFLFTSEPTTSSKLVDGCRVLGRYVIQRWTKPETAAAIAAGRVAPRLGQMIFWNTKKALKAVGGNYYAKARRSPLFSLVGSSRSFGTASGSERAVNTSPQWESARYRSRYRRRRESNDEA